MTDTKQETAEYAPLSASQALFWKGHLLQPEAPVYNMAWRFDLFLDLEENTFKCAFQDVASASDAMRAVYHEVDGHPVQMVGKSLPDFPDTIDLSSEQDPGAALSAGLEDWIAEPFDLARCAYRTRLARLGPQHWVWCFAQHHISCDAQSGEAMLRAVSDRYCAIVQGCRNEAVSLPSFFDKVQSWVPTSELADPVSDKRRQKVMATLPYGAVRTRKTSSVRATVPINQELHSKIAGFAADPEYRLITPALSRFAVYLTAYVAFLNRVTGDEQICIGVPSHNRMSVTDKTSLGLFVEVLPMEFSLERGETFRSLEGKVKTEIGQFLKNARPNAVLTAPDAAVSGVLNFIETNYGDFAGMPVQVEICHSGAHDAEHGLRLHVMTLDGSAPHTVALDIGDDVLQRTDADKIVTHFERVLSASIADPNQQLAAVDMCSESERQQVASLSVGTPETGSTWSSVLDGFQHRVKANPEQTAIVCGDERLSFDELAAEADAMAAHLMSQGVKPGSTVAVHMRRSPELVIAILGVLKAGASFVPIASNTPAVRCAEIVALAQAHAVIVDGASEPKVADTGVPLIRSEARGSLADYSSVQTDPSNTAYVLFTSGSTGVPKGVVVTHEEFARYIRWASDEFSGSEPASYALFSSISFDLTLTSIFTPLVTGGKIVIYPERSDPDLAVLDVFSDDTVDVVKLTPSHLSLAVEANKAVSKIRTLVLGGENLTAGLCRQAQSVLSPELKIINEYGPTEAVVGCMSHHFDTLKDLHPSVPIGHPASGVEISIRDEGLNLVPIGVPGEIFVAGRLSDGYYRRDDLTAEKFLVDPLDPEQLVYKTGDLGRLRADGIYEYLGRSDRQLKINGIRIETAEIEAAILAAPGVGAAYVSTDVPATKHGKTTQTCTRCGIPGNVPGIVISKDGVCDACTEFDAIRDRAEAYFQAPSVLADKLANAARKRRGNYDAIMLLSGGKDSTYAAYRLADLSKRVLALTLDNGFISEGAKVNIRRVTDHLGWDHRFLTTDAMNEIFVDSLKTFSNVCQGCFKTIYTLALRVARDEGIPAIVTGLSRGQFFETRLTPDLFSSASPTTVELEDIVMEARKSYHAKDDAIARLLNTHDICNEGLLDQIEVIDLYRYIDVPVSEIYRFLAENAPWIRPEDTGRSTNCKINDVGIFVHKQREGFHNYALPYSWDVRVGHKTRDQALEELNDDIDEAKVREMLDVIGFDEPVAPTSDKPGVVAYAAASGETSESAIWEVIKDHLPRDVQPDHLIVLDQIPLTDNGKVDTDRLPVPKRSERKALTDHVAPRNPQERQIVGIFEDVLSTKDIGVYDDFFDLGGDSLAAIKIAMQANELGLALPATALFSHSTVAKLAAEFGAPSADLSKQVALEDDDGLLDLDDADLESIKKALS